MISDHDHHKNIIESLCDQSYQFLWVSDQNGREIGHLPVEEQKERNESDDDRFLSSSMSPMSLEKANMQRDNNIETATEMF
jgi:hypothetical protein